MSLQHRQIPVTPFQQNCSLVWCDVTQQAAIIDPGGDLENILNKVEQHQVKVCQIFLTHGHLDHAGGANGLAKQLHIPIIGPHQDDDFWLQGMQQQAESYGFPGVEVCQPDQWLQDGDSVNIGNESLQVYHCPGHTPGHVIFYHKDSQFAFVGDVLFKGSIGRTDFPKGDFDTLINSITSKLWPLGNTTQFVPGHGEISNFEDERKTNPFVADSVLK